VELFAAIRRDARVDGLSIRELAAKHRVHRRTVRQALASAIPPPRKIPMRTSPRLEPFKAAIDEMLRGDLDAPKKQRHTARRILARLVDEHGAKDLSYSRVRDYVAKRRPEIAAEAGRPLEEGCVPQTHLPAAEAEVDFHDLWVILRGIKTKTALFTMRLSFSGRAAHRASLSQGQEAFLESHVYALERLGGVPTDQVRYDNLKPAVSRVLFGRTRVESDRWTAFRSHYGFDAFYCRPGHEGSHEKGGVEGEGGRFRRTHFQTSGGLLLALAMVDLDRGARTGEEWATRSGARMVALAERFRFLRNFQPTMSAARARHMAEQADRPAYEDAVSSYAGLGHEDLRAAALAALAARERPDGGLPDRVAVVQPLGPEVAGQGDGDAPGDGDDGAVADRGA
jgi:transposase